MSEHIEAKPTLRGLRVLITNNTLSMRAGTELYVRDLAKALLRLGHFPIAYSPILGEIAQEIRACGTAVVDDLNLITCPPDIIHGQHLLPTAAALMRFPETCAAFFCHGWIPWQESPPRFPRIRRYVAMNRSSFERLRTENGIPEKRIAIIPNFADTDRFQPRPPLPPQPQRALFFSNTAAPEAVAAVRSACEAAGIMLDVLGCSSRNASGTPELVLPLYDLVFAAGRSAIEALVTGCAVIPCHIRNCGPLVTSANLAELRSDNFALRCLHEPLTADVIRREIGHYQPADCAAVSDRMREEASLDNTVKQILGVYQAVLAEPFERDAQSVFAENAALTSYLKWLEGPMREWGCLKHEHLEAARRSKELELELGRLKGLEPELKRIAGLEPELRQLQEQLRSIECSATIRLRNRVMALPGVPRVSRLLKRFLVKI